MSDTHETRETNPSPSDSTPSPPEIPVDKALLALYDRFVHFHDTCSFLCEAFVCVASQGEGLDDAVVQGMADQAGWLRSELGAIKDELRDCYERAAEAADTHPVPPPQE